MNDITPHERLLPGCLIFCAISFVLTIIIAAGATWLTIKSRDDAPPGYIGSPDRGRQLMTIYGCTGCHVIPGNEEKGMVGPSLERVGGRAYIAGQFANSRIEMESWIRNPRAMKPDTAMPDVGVSERDARDIAAYLATLR